MLARCSAVSPQAMRITTSASTAATVQRVRRFVTTRPMTWSCMGMKYFDWSSSRR